MSRSEKILKKTAILMFGLALGYSSFAATTADTTKNTELEKLIRNQYKDGNTDLNINKKSANTNTSYRDSGNVNRMPEYTANKRIQGAPDLNLTREQLLSVADKIFKNETGGSINELVAWNDGENFPSLGIGHFTWFKASGGRSGFGDSLPEMVAYYRKQGIKLPKILEENRFSPWQSKSELMAKKARGDKDIQELISFFDSTRDIQVMFIYERLKSSLDKMLNASSNKENLKNQFNRMVETPNGLYALIDYVNFKGEGLSGVSSYNNVAWGLRQVLENMRGTAVGQSALVEFSNSAKAVLTRRVNNAPRNERRWLQGWYNRVDTYKTFEIGSAGTTEIGSAGSTYSSNF